MKISPKPRNEDERLRALHSYQILDTEAEQDFDEIVKLASLTCGTPSSLIGLIDDKRQWYKACIGVDDKEVARDLSFCSYTLHMNDIMIVEDATKDERFVDHPMVTGLQHIRFYAGVPLITGDGYVLGTLCVIDSKPKTLDEAQTFALRMLGRQVMKLIELRIKVKELNLLNEELKIAKEAAEQATRAKSQFLSVMSHEIRTPMNAIIGLTNFLLEDEPKENHLESLGLIKFSGENLLSIINDILDFSKIEANKVDLESINVDLHQLLNNLISVTKLRAQAKGLNLVLNIDKLTPRVVKTDPVRLSQILTNLVGNAVKFTEKGYVEMKVETTLKGNNLFELSFHIRDTGIGIEKDKIDGIFESFSQVGADTTRKFGGTGLGLSITKGLLKRFGTDIHVESYPGFGSTFSFKLLLEQGTSIEKKESFETKGTNLRLDSLKVLIVDDNPVNQVVAAKLIKKWGAEIDIANDGYEAIEKIKSKEFNVVLMDLQMPGMDGYEATKKIREMDDPYFKSVPIIALTADALVGEQNKTAEAGMSGYLSKPFQPEVLRGTLHSAR